MDMTVPSLIFGRISQPTAPVNPVRITQENPYEVQPQQKANPWGPAAIVTISPEGRAAYEASISKVEKIGGDTDGASVGETAKANETSGCQTCQNRTYVDGSNDGGVSFQTPTHIAPSAAAAAVASHEGEHVSREQDKAEQDGREVISQNVRLHTSVCPECGITYVSGGVTETTTAEKSQNNQDDAVQLMAASMSAAANP
ncbi:MAG: hypothetical protein LBB56_04350 [Chitinispirillales bacterium]|nr:hypothetical protein [Chitinispirillales bacterium]